MTHGTASKKLTVVGYCWGPGVREQTRMIRHLAKALGADIESVHVETDTGRHSKWEELDEAIYDAKRLVWEGKRPLVVISWIRGKRKWGIARNVVVLEKLIGATDEGVEQLQVVSADTLTVDTINPDQPHDILDVVSALHRQALEKSLVAAREFSDGQSQRKRQEMAARKKAGEKVGVDNLTQQDRLAGAKATRQQAIDEYREIGPEILKLHKSGKSFRTIAEQLNELGKVTRRGKPWTGTQVGRVLNLFKLKGGQSK